MTIQFTGLNQEMSDALREYTQDKFSRLKKLATNITSIHVTFEVDKFRHIAEASIRVPKNEFHAKAESEDMYKSIDVLADKLFHQLSKHKEKVTEHS